MATRGRLFWFNVLTCGNSFLMALWAQTHNSGHTSLFSDDVLSCFLVFHENSSLFSYFFLLLIFIYSISVFHIGVLLHFNV